MMKENSMDSKKEFVEVNGEHWYESKKHLGVFYPSVTTILSVFPKGVGFNKYLTAQVSWETSQEILKEAGKRGTLVHKTTEMLEAGGTVLRPGFSVQEWQMVAGFVNWHTKHSPVVKHVEHGLVSDKLKIGGTIDRIYQIDGSNVLLDIKTSGSIYDNYWAQVAAYAEMFEADTKTKIDYTAILRLTDRKKEYYEYVLRSRDEWKEDLKIFKATKQIWDYLNPNAKPKIVELPAELSLKKNEEN